jgi:hypothetical protein
MHAEKELQGCQQKDQSNIDDNLNQFLVREEQEFVKVEIEISRRAVASTTAATSSTPPPPPPTSTQQSGKTLIHAEIVQPDRESATTEKKEFDVKSENHRVTKLKDCFMLATKSNIAKIGDVVLNVSTTHAIIKQQLVNTKFDLPLSQHNCSANHCDKEELCDGASIIHAPQLLNEIDSFVLAAHIYAESTNFQPIATEQDKLKLLSSLNTLGYIEFDTLCALTTLEEKFTFADLSRLSRCTFHFIGKYNNKGEYMVHRVYICSNLKSSFIVQQYDNFEACNRYYHVMSRSPSFVIKQHVKFQEGEQYLQSVLQLSSNRGRIVIKKGRMMRT